MNKLAIGSLSLLLMSAVTAPMAVAGMKEENPDTRIEKYETKTETEPDSVSQVEPAGSDMDMDNEETRSEQTLEEYQTTGSSSNESMYDVRKTEAFNLVTSAYRGQYESQGINSYAVMVSNVNSGELSAEDLIQAAVDAGDLSPQALEDEGYVNAVELQLDTLRNER